MNDFSALRRTIGLMDERTRPIAITIANEYTVDFPLWDAEGLINEEDVDISEELRRDLVSFGRRWNDSVSLEVSDDRWDDEPFMRSLVRLRYAVPKRLNPLRRRRAVTEYAEMRKLGEDLRARLQEELGSGYHVTYRHF